MKVLIQTTLAFVIIIAAAAIFAIGWFRTTTKQVGPPPQPVEQYEQVAPTEGQPTEETE